MNPLFLPLTLDYQPTWTRLISCLLIAFALFAATKDLRKLSLGKFRLVSILTFLFVIFFQIPLFLYEGILKKGLIDFNSFYFSIHSISLLSSLWILGSNYVLKTRQNEFVGDRTLPERQNNRLSLALFGIVLIFTLIYSFKVGPQCTGLFALLFDPNVMLLAREASIKLVGSSLATLSHGILINAACPLAVVMFVQQIKSNSIRKKFRHVAFFTAALFATLFLTIITGAKGALAPTLIAVLASILLSSQNWKQKISSGIVASASLLSFMLVIELAKERYSSDEHLYNYGYCIKRIEKCEEGKTLLDSLDKRVLSLGFGSQRLFQLKNNLADYCGFDKPTPLTEDLQSQPQAVDQVSIGNTSSRMDTILLYTRSLFYRAFAIPVQVGSWHFQYVQEFGSPGIAALPLAKKIFGESVDMTSLVHEKYGTLYSGGASVSTGTSPTSFLIAYPAYWGIKGLLFSLFLLFSFDLILVFVLMKLSKGSRLLIGSLSFAIAINFILSDFLTTILTHGGSATVLLGLTLWGIETIDSSKRAQL